MEKIDIAKVFSVYSGKANKCCCGCAGIHRFARAHREAAERNRGYTITENEINDGQVRRVVNLINEHLDLIEIGPDHVAIELDGRQYVAYTK